MLILARHGETPANAGRLMVGKIDPPLTDRGRRQAEAVAASLPAGAVVLSSPLRRARDTAGAYGQPEVDDRWREVDYGELDGRPAAETWLPLWEEWQADPEYAPPGGESLASVGRRVREACEELYERAAAGDVVVFTHVGPIKAAVAWALHVGDGVARRKFVALASVSRVDVGERGPLLHSFNEVHHLAGVDAG
ncbi:MAG TPA: histidine phosphatase family protein [Acidimicrobiales bacterium]|nr:histidine phosphatase family protein [Acidimicrobiales bacterium]